MNKMVGLLSLVAMVGVLGIAMFFISSGRGNVAIESQAAPTTNVVGTVWAATKDSCTRNYYIGCYKLIKQNGAKINLVEANRNVKLNDYIGLKVNASGRLVQAGKSNVFMVTSIITSN